MTVHINNEFKGRNLNCVCEPVVADRGPFRDLPRKLPMINTFKLADHKGSYTPIHLRWSGR